MFKLGYANDYGNALSEFLSIHSIKKPTRRAPLINRGYYIRHKSMQYTINEFLKLASSKKNNFQIINLGCGFDPTYFHLEIQSKAADQLTYFDVDFPDLCDIKRDTINKKDLLREKLYNPNFIKSDGTGVKIASKKYFLIGCDLRKLEDLEGIFRDIDAFKFEYPTLIISECVLTYILVSQSNEIIQWCSNSFPNSVLAIYEQINPDSAFGRTMIQHFKNQNAPIFAIHQYKTLDMQKSRLKSLGFDSVFAHNMYSFWSRCLDDTERKRIAEIEWFDEYEEWEVKCRHYFVACGMKGPFFSDNFRLDKNEREGLSRISSRATYQEQKLEMPIRRWGHCSAKIGDDKYLIYGGYGAKFNTNRSDTKLGKFDDFLVVKSLATHPDYSAYSGGPMPRMYASLVSNGNDAYLYGGRDSPCRIYGDLWKYSSSKNSWSTVNSNGVPRFRHCAILSNYGAPEYHPIILAHGGQTLNENSDGLTTIAEFACFDLRDETWRCIAELQECSLPPMHSHAMLDTDDTIYIYGGLDEKNQPQNWFITIRKRDWHVIIHRDTNLPCRYSHQLHYYDQNHILVVGGLGDEEFGGQLASNFLLNVQELYAHSGSTMRNIMPAGHQSFFDPDSKKLSLLGGGLVCFSMGSFFNESRFIYMDGLWHKERSSLDWVKNSNYLPRVPCDKSLLDKFFDAKKPFIVKCSNNTDGSIDWKDKNYLKSCSDSKVSIHVSNENQLKFDLKKSKNFSYETVEWSEFIEELFSDSQRFMYLRTIGNNPRKQKSDVAFSFPELAKNVYLPADLASKIGPKTDLLSGNHGPFLNQINSENFEKFFSSVLRISSGGLQLWTHFDVMDNYLIQLTGSKLVTLFPPSEAQNLGLSTDANQSSSPFVDIFAPYSNPYSSDDIIEVEPSKMQAFQEATKKAYVNVLQPGDILFLPALWFHNVYSLYSPNPQPIISINIFWRELSDEEYDRKDLYGNKDLKKAADAQKLVEEAKSLLDKLPSKYKDFYLDRLKRIL